MIDERFAAAVSAWLRRTDSPSRHAQVNVGQAMAQIRDRHRRRRLWFLPGRKPTAGADEPEDQPRATDRMTSGQMPAPIGGTRAMFSATKLVGIAAAMAVFGALLVAGPLGTPSEDSAPAAAPVADHGEISRFTGTMRFLDTEDSGEEPVSTRYDWGEAITGMLWSRASRRTTRDTAA